MNTILVLYTELMPYNVVVFKALIDKGCRLHVVLWDKGKLTPYHPSVEKGITYYYQSTFWNIDHLYLFVKQLNPDLVWTAGWMDPMYNKVCTLIRRDFQIPVIASSDTQWRGGKQWFNVLTARFRHRRWFSHLFVSGEPQVIYARKLGFHSKQILMNNLSADVDLFHRIDLKSREVTYPRRLLYIGRFAKVKGLSYLLEAWQSLPDRRDWKLVLVGNGPEYSKLQGYPDVEIKNFMPQEELMKELEQSGAFILPSVFEPWALVIHEAACSGLPILASTCSGAASCFVKNGENGFLFKSGSKCSIRRAIYHFIHLQESEWLQMGRKSREFSSLITPSIVADRLLTLLK